MGEEKNTVLFKSTDLQREAATSLIRGGTRVIKKSKWVVILRVVNSSQTIELQVDEPITVGRALDKPTNTHIDLTAHDATDYGVSRRHIALRSYKNHLVVRDLNSTNGTAINDSRVLAHTDVPLNTGDILRMGKLELRVILAAKVPAE